MKIEYEINDKSAKKVLERLYRNNHNRRAAMKQITRILLASTDETFEKEGQPKWPALKKPRPGKILQRSKRLLNSMTGRNDNDSSTVGTDVIYGTTHQYGDPDRNISRRTFLDIQNDDIKESQGVLTKHLMRGI